MDPRGTTALEPMEAYVIQLHLETTGACNCACAFCIYPSDENRVLPKAAMPLDLYHRIIDEAATIPVIEQVAFAGLAEPLLDPHLFHRIEYAKKARPAWRIEMYTNGILLTPERFDRLKDLGLDVLCISLNAIDAAQHERIMGVKGKFDLVCENIDYAITHKAPMSHVDVRAVLTQDTFTIEDAQAFLRRWGTTSLGGYGKVIGEMNWAAQLPEGRTIAQFDPNEWCQRATGQFSVHRDGRVNLCCLDALSKNSWGDLKTQTIREVYNAALYTRFRELHSLNRAAEAHPMCAGCSRV